MHEANFEINISRVRRAIDFWSEFTGGERLVAGVIADHFNADEGYAFPSYRYLEFVYGFSQTTIANTVGKLQEGLMTVDQAGGNNRYVPDTQKVEAVLADLEVKRDQWKKEKAARRASGRGAPSRRTPAPGDEAPASGGGAPASDDGARLLREMEPNVQGNAQPKAQHERAKALASCERGPVDLDRSDDCERPRPKWASHPEGFLAGDWWWDDKEFQPAIDLLGFDEYELDAEINRFIKHHRGERRHDWNPAWLEWIQTLNARRSSDGEPELAAAGDYESERHDDEDPSF